MKKCYRILLTVTLLLMLPGGAFAQKWAYKSDCGDGLTIVKDKDGKWGFIDEKGKILGQMWRNVGYFQEDLAPVEDENERYGFIDRTGTVVIPCQFKYAYWFNEGMAWITSDDGFNHGYIDKTGKIVIPCIYKETRSFSNGVARVVDEDGNEFYIDKTGKKVEE